MAKEQVETVLGAINAEDLGITLSHEHLAMDCSYCVIPPANNSETDKFNEPITLANLNWLRHNPYKSLVSTKQAKEKEAVIADLKDFKKSGGATIVDNTSIGINRDVLTMVEISKATGVQVVCGTRFFVEDTLTDQMKVASVEKLTEIIMSDITEGIDKTPVKAGIIGEVGTSWPLTEVEKRSLQASAIAQSCTHTSVMIHPAQEPRATFEILRIFQEAGGDAKHTVIAHLDRTIMRKDILTELAETGVFLEYDFFGLEISYYSLKPSINQLSDAQRIDYIIHLMSEGFSDKVLVAHDIHACHQLTKYGGHGFSHILDYVVPKMHLKGFTPPDIDRILVSNPTSWLTYN